MKTIRSAALALLLAACTTPEFPGDEVDSAVLPMASAPISQDAVLTRIAFGSCLKQADPMPIFEAIAAREPQLMVLLGDNVYGDVDDLSDRDMPELRRAYRTLAQRSEFTNFRRSVPLLTVWDDHDYGRNDAGRDFPLKDEAEDIFLDAWAIAEDDPRRARPGVYTSETFGPEGRRVQIILLDTRFFRSDLTPTDDRGAPGKERYLASRAKGQTMLGAAQEAWLARELQKPADLRILVSSVQLLAEGHGWEAWRTLPEAQQRLYDTIIESGVRNLVVVSGDRHLGGLYGDQSVVPFPLYEMTASSLNAPQSTWREEAGQTSIEPGPKRLGKPVYVENFGEIEIDWASGSLTMSVIDGEGDPVRTATFPIETPRDRYRQPNPRVQDL